MDLLTHSRRRAFNSCHYKHHLAYELAIKPVRTSLARAIGDLAIRAYEQGRADERREQRARRIDAAMASQALRKVQATLHQHRPTVIDVDAYEALLADDAAAE